MKKIVLILLCLFTFGADSKSQIVDDILGLLGTVSKKIQQVNTCLRLSQRALEIPGYVEYYTTSINGLITSINQSKRFLESGGLSESDKLKLAKIVNQELLMLTSILDNIITSLADLTSEISALSTAGTSNIGKDDSFVATANEALARLEKFNEKNLRLINKCRRLSDQINGLIYEVSAQNTLLKNIKKF